MISKVFLGRAKVWVASILPLPRLLGLLPTYFMLNPHHQGLLRRRKTEILLARCTFHSATNENWGIRNFPPPQFTQLSLSSSVCQLWFSMVTEMKEFEKSYFLTVVLEKQSKSGSLWDSKQTLRRRLCSKLGDQQLLLPRSLLLRRRMFAKQEPDGRVNARSLLCYFKWLQNNSHSNPTTASSLGSNYITDLRASVPLLFYLPFCCCCFNTTL